MAKLVSALVAGLVFGFGLGLSHMVDPAKVLGFLDVAGAWDPSLILVMASATGVAGVAFWFVSYRTRPFFEKAFMLPTVKHIDVKLVGGAVLFGVGWGLVGFLPRARDRLFHLRRSKFANLRRGHDSGLRADKVDPRYAPRRSGLTAFALSAPHRAIC